MDISTYTYRGGRLQNCTRYMQRDEITSVIIPDGGAANQTIFTAINADAILMYPPWQITWAEEDAATLSPAPPRIAPHSFVPTWTPGEKPTQYSFEPYGGGGIATAALSTAIVVPIVLFFSALAGAFFCIRSRRRKERLVIEKEEREASEQATTAAASAAAVAAQQSDQVNTTRDSDQNDEVTAASSQTNGPSLSPPAPSLVGSSGEGVAVPGGPSTHHQDQQQPQPQPQPQHMARSAEAHSHSLSQVSKPLFPGLPSQGFDRIEEPPPYEQSPSSNTTRGAQQPQSQQTHHSEEDTHSDIVTHQAERGP